MTYAACAALVCADDVVQDPHALEFQMVYRIRGWARLCLEDIGEICVETYKRNPPFSSFGPTKLKKRRRLKADRNQARGHRAA